VQLRDANPIKAGKPLRIFKDILDDHSRAVQRAE
jgi:hypothetical protein